MADHTLGAILEPAMSPKKFMKTVYKVMAAVQGTIRKHLTLHI
jgi:hypothetical protein